MNTNDYQKQQSQAIDSYYQTQAKITQMKRSGASEEQIQAQQQKAEHFQNLTNSLTTNITVSKTIDAAGNAVQSIIDNATSSVTSTIGGIADTANNVVNSANAAVSQLTDTASQLLKTSEAMIDKASQSVKDLLAADNGGIDKLFSGDAKTTENANKLATPAADKGQKEADTKMKEISAEDASSAVVKPVSFVTKQVTEVVSGTTSAISSISKELVDTTSKLGKSLTGTGISDMQSAISKVSGDLAKQTSAASSSIGNFVSAATGTINNTISSAVSGVTSATSGIVGSISSSIKGITNGTDGVMSSVMSTVKSGITATKSFVTPIMDVGNSIIETGRAASAQIASAFPESIGKYINGASDSYFNGLTNKLANSKLGNVSKILAKLDGVTEKGNVLSTFASLKGLYSSNTDSSGNPIASNGSADSSTSDRLYKLAQQLCDGITNNSGKDFSFDKDFYDLLMALAADLGMSDLIKQLADCGASKNYFDSRTLNMLKSKLPEVSKSGNPTALSGIVETVGSHNVSKFSDKIKVLIGNTTSDTAKEQKGVISKLMENANTSVKSLCESTSSVVKSFDAKSVAIMTSTNTTVVDEAIGKDDRSMVQASLLAYET